VLVAALQMCDARSVCPDSRRADHRPADYRLSGHAESATGRDHLQLKHAVIKIIEALFIGETLFVEQFSGHAAFGDVPAGEVAGADIDDFPLFLQDVHGFPQFLMAAIVVDVVHLEDFEMVGLQALEGAFAMLEDLIS
jgi:hypothetical protein